VFTLHKQGGKAKSGTLILPIDYPNVHGPLQSSIFCQKVILQQLLSLIYQESCSERRVFDFLVN